jgi:S1-C subfamily serine protease
LVKQAGVVLKYITPGSPAKLDGKLEDNDVLLAVNGQPIPDTQPIKVSKQKAGK